MSFEIEAGVIAARITTLEGRADAQDIELAKIPAAIASAVDSATAPLIAQIALLESKVITLEAGVAALQAAGGEEMKALQMNASNKSMTVATGLDLDTSSDGVLAPCAILFGCKPAGNTTVITNNNSFNSRGLEAKINSSKIRLIGGSASNEQTITTGTAVWSDGTAGLGAGIWDGSSWTIIRDGVVDTTATETTRSATPGYAAELRFNDDDDNHDLWAGAYIRGTVSVSQVVAIQAKIASGDVTGAAEDINGFNAAAGCLIGPTATDDPTTVVGGVVERCAGRATQTNGSPALIDIPT